MSRVGKKPISIPEALKVKVEKIGENELMIRGPKGELKVAIPEGISAQIQKNEVVINRQSDSISHRSKHGLVRSLVANAVEGVTKGFQKDLEIVGIGYKANLDGKDLVISLGYSSPARYPIPDGIEIKLEKQTKISVSGIDKQQVGDVAARIRNLKKPDVYKGKGIRYEKEFIKLKEGKAGA
jgi:large subunit ribosomal protein L6